MKIDYNITGDIRKSFVGILSRELNRPVKYLGMPTANYEVGEYCISKTGLLVGPDDRGLVAKLREDGFEPSNEEYNAPEEALDESDQLVIEVPLDGFIPEKLDNLVKMVSAKAPLLKAALGVENVPIQMVDEDDGKLRFTWSGCDLDADTVRACTILVEKICKTAKEKKRITAKAKEQDNPRYAMRCWLLSLGFIGDEYKEARKILLKNLSGSSAYKSKIQ